MKVNIQAASMKFKIKTDYKNIFIKATSFDSTG